MCLQNNVIFGSAGLCGRLHLLMKGNKSSEPSRLKVTHVINHDSDTTSP